MRARDPRNQDDARSTSAALHLVQEAICTVRGESVGTYMLSSEDRAAWWWRKELGALLLLLCCHHGLVVCSPRRRRRRVRVPRADLAVYVLAVCIPLPYLGYIIRVEEGDKGKRLTGRGEGSTPVAVALVWRIGCSHNPDHAMLPSTLCPTIIHASIHLSA